MKVLSYPRQEVTYEKLHMRQSGCMHDKSGRVTYETDKDWCLKSSTKLRKSYLV